MSTRKTTRPRKRGRPVEFDREAALDAALETFWRRGYGNASLDELTTAMNINRPSLYGAFGNKEQLYAASVDHYVAKIGASYLAPLTEPKLADALNGFFDAMIDGVTGKHGPRGCIVACTMPAEAGVSPLAQAQLAAVLDQIDGAWIARLGSAQAAGEIAKRRDPRALGQLVASGMLALSIRARTGAKKRTLRAIADEIVAAVFAP
ncbi:MAG TPA: TetR/AcrR family transcriptional regulator [Myxococcota bacterium]|jgi:AcrR family transcriptional regulator